ncbi:MAG: M3 family oligoendopeptidase, partial [Thermodesulfobacteriota bacterium]
MSKAKKSRTGAEGVKWNLNDLYKGINDTRIERDIRKIQQNAKNFEKRYRNKIKSSKLSSATLFKAVKELEQISEGLGRILSFAYLLFACDTNNQKFGAFLQSMQEKTTEIRNMLMFFDLEWVKLPDKTATRLLKDKKLSGYAHFLKHEREYKPHTLSEPEEKILAEKANTGSRAFSRLFDEVINNIAFDIKLNGKVKSMTETEILSLQYHPDRKTRKLATESLTNGLEKNAHILTYIFNTLVNEHSINDRLRTYPHIMASRNLSNEIDNKTVRVLIDTTVKNYSMVATYYNLKKKLLGLRKMYEHDRYAPVLSEDKTIKYSECKKIVLEAFSDFSPKMAQIAKMFFNKNWIDAELREGKRGGAFSHGTVPGVHPYVFVNYSGKMRDVMTVAHELGHGIHQYLSRKQGYFQADTPLTTAETASVFAEMLVFHKLIEYEKNNKIKLAIMCGKLEDIFATVFRQVVLTNFEEELHTSRRSSGELSKEKINELWMKTNKAMYGNSVELTDNYKIWWMYIPHFIHSPFYCYAYSFGELLVLALYQKYIEEGKSFVPKYIDMLSSGGSDAPENIVKKVGVNIKDPKFWQGG